MRRHELKLSEEFAGAVLAGDKTFEVRINDRGFQTGDEVTFRVVDKHGIAVFGPLDGKVFKITYILSGWGIDPNYVVFGIRPYESAI